MVPSPALSPRAASSPRAALSPRAAPSAATAAEPLSKDPAGANVVDGMKKNKKPADVPGLVVKKKKKKMKKVAEGPGQLLKNKLRKAVDASGLFKKKLAGDAAGLPLKKKKKKSKTAVVVRPPPPTGSLWPKWQNTTVGRIIVRPSDGRRGVVQFSEASMCEQKFAATDYRVRWDGMGELEAAELVPQRRVAAWTTDVFAEEPFVKCDLLDLQENGWEPLPEGWERKRSVVGWTVPPAKKSTRKKTPEQIAAAKEMRELKAAEKAAAGGAANATGGVKKARIRKPAAPRVRKPAASKAAGGTKRAAEVVADEAAVMEEEEEEEDVPLGDDPVLSKSTNRLLPAALCLRPGNKRVDELDDEDMLGDFVVERILDQRPHGVRGKLAYLVKWKGFELNLGTDDNPKGDWEPHSNVQGCEALVRWEKARPAWWTAQQDVQPPAHEPPAKKARKGK